MWELPLVPLQGARPCGQIQLSNYCAFDHPAPDRCGSVIHIKTSSFQEIPPQENRALTLEPLPRAQIQALPLTGQMTLAP